MPILALGGYSSQTFTDDVADDVERDGRPAVLVYAGDFDASGEDIDRDFTDRSRCWAKVERIALNADQVIEYQLPPQPGKVTDSRAEAFTARHGALMQVELDALAPDTLRSLYENALARWMDASIYEQVLALEDDERNELSPCGDR